MTDHTNEKARSWDYASHPGDCCPRIESGLHTVCCRECAGTGMFPVPWVQSVAEARTSGDAGCVACKETGRAVVTVAAAQVSTPGKPGGSDE